MGQEPVSGSASSRFSRLTARTNISCSTPRWSAPTSRRRPEKGGPKSGFGAFPRRIDHQDPYARRQSRSTAALHPHRRATHDIVAAPALLDGMDGAAVIADKAYDSNDFARPSPMPACSPSSPPSVSQSPIPHDAILYKARNRIERCFNKLKHFRRFATRFDRARPFSRIHPSRTL